MCVWKEMVVSIQRGRKEVENGVEEERIEVEILFLNSELGYKQLVK